MSYIVLLLTLVAVVNADIYMHNLAGSNNRNRERNENRNNNNRVFDSQNNAKGGYPWRGDREIIGAADPLNLYEGSMIKMEWTNQHSCGLNPNAHCSVILQYGCEDTLPGVRDGWPSSATLIPVPNDNNGYMQAAFARNNNNGNDLSSGTGSISAATATDHEYGMHEDLTYYQTYCQQRQRNQGLYTADQILNGNDATKTRQNPNGGQSGFECPEERDYYPYWHPTPWRDVAILTSNSSFCPYYQANSQNVVGASYCFMTDAQRATTKQNLRPIDSAACTAAGGQWVNVPAFNIPAPTCTVHDFTRDNHLGNVASLAVDGQPEPASYAFQVPFVSQMMSRVNLPLPDPAATTSPNVAAQPMYNAAQYKDINGNIPGIQCVMRLRYNVSTNDYPSMKGMDGSGSFFDSKYNCPRVKSSSTNTDIDTAATSAADPTLSGCSLKLDDGNRPRYNRPYVQMFDDPTTPKISIAMNTNQLGRTFQDRSYNFLIKKRPDGVGPGVNIWNINNRGRRGNIVQSYPAVEYDFVPNVLTVNKNDYLHIQFHGSDFNQPENPNNAEGWQFSDRFNMVQVQERNTQIPLKASESTLFQSQAEALRYALLDQEKNLTNPITNVPFPVCMPFIAGANNEQNSPNNCGKMNAAPSHFDFGLKAMTTINRGTYQYISTRNNNFSNRSQKATLFVTGFSTAEAIGISIGVIGGVGTLAAGGLFLVKKGKLKVPASWGMNPVSAQRLGSTASPQARV